ncbi:MAG: two-component regulator propeller domain-containing protein [Bryobacteraceae bacterium]
MSENRSGLVGWAISAPVCTNIGAQDAPAIDICPKAAVQASSSAWTGWILVLGLLFSALSSQAQPSLDSARPITEYIHQVWQSAQGLPQNSVLSIAQTPDGYLWLGTEEGLVRFDGARFTVFDKHSTPGLQNNQILALLVDRRHNLWIGTNGGGLSRFSNGTFTAYTSRDGLSNNSILSLYEDKRGAIWIGTDGGGLIRFQNGRFHVFTKADGLSDNAVFSVSGDDSGTLWIGTHAGLSKFSGGKFITCRAADALATDYIRSTHVDRHGSVWVGTNGDGVYRITSSGTTRFSTKDGLPSNGIFSVYEDRAGSIWIGTGSGLDRFSNGEFSAVKTTDKAQEKEVWTVFQDREGSLWFGTGGNGLNCLKKGSFTTLSKDDGLVSDVILPVYEDTEGALWMGSDQGLTRWKDGQITTYTTKQGLPDNLVFSIVQDRAGNMWIGTRRGLSRLKNGVFTKFNGENGLPNDFVLCTYIDRKGDLWVGTRGGLSRFDGHQFITYTTRDGLSNNNVLSLYEDEKESLWISTGGGGLNRLKDGRFSIFTTRDGLANDFIWSIYGEPDGSLWLATNGGGLSRFRNGKFTTYSIDKGLYDDAVFGILDDKLGHLWMSSNKGVFSVSKQQLEAFAEGRVASITSVAYGTADGMKTRECNGGFQPANWRTRDGRLCFPSMRGLAIVNPAHLVKNELPPPVVLERVLVDNKDLPLNKPVVLPPGKGQLEFQFTAPSFIAPEKVQFRYMLEGFDKDWTQAGSRRVAYYTNIPPGEYHFRVVACNNDQVWSTDAAALSLTLRPHYYQTAQFDLFLGLMILSLCAGVYGWRVNQLKMREETLKLLVNERTSALQESEKQLRRSRDELELRVEERTSELMCSNQALGAEIHVRRRTEEQLIEAKDAAEAASRAKSEFLANMSHEIRTPINGILGMTDITLSTELDDEQREYLEAVKISSDSLLAIVNDILDFSKIEARKLTLEKTVFHTATSIDELVRSVSLRARQKTLSLKAHLDPEIPIALIGDPLRLRQVLLNLTDNAIKFTSEGNITLSVTTDQLSDTEAVLHFAVADTGIGIPVQKQKTIFEAFSQADSSSTRRYGGTGLGLTISYQLVALMGGRLWVESEPGAGSTFHFTARFERLAPAQSSTVKNQAPVCLSA